VGGRKCRGISLCEFQRIAFTYGFVTPWQQAEDHARGERPPDVYC
jgi:hypothetical protein